MWALIWPRIRLLRCNLWGQKIALQLRVTFLQYLGNIVRFGVTAFGKTLASLTGRDSHYTSQLKSFIVCGTERFSSTIFNYLAFSCNFCFVTYDNSYSFVNSESLWQLIEICNVGYNFLWKIVPPLYDLPFRWYPLCCARSWVVYSWYLSSFKNFDKNDDHLRWFQCLYFVPIL